MVAGVGRPSARDNISSLWPVERAVSLSISPALPADKSWTSREGRDNILLSPVFIFQCQMGMKTTGVSLCPKKKKYPSLPFPWTWTSPVSRPLSSTPTTRCTSAFIKTSQLNKIEPLTDIAILTPLLWCQPCHQDGFPRLCFTRVVGALSRPHWRKRPLYALLIFGPSMYQLKLATWRCRNMIQPQSRPLDQRFTLLLLQKKGIYYGWNIDITHVPRHKPVTNNESAESSLGHYRSW